MRKDWRTETVQPEVEKGQGNFMNTYTFMKGRCKGDGARLFSVVASDRTKGKGHTLETQEVPFTHQKTLFHHAGDWTLTQVTQRGTGRSILEDIQNPSGHGPLQLTPGDPPWESVDRTRGPSKVPFQPRPFCGSVILRKVKSYIWTAQNSFKRFGK